MDGLKLLLVIAFVIAVVAGWPILFIWALNVLFPVLAIPITLQTWTAAFIVMAALNTVSFASNKK